MLDTNIVCDPPASSPMPAAWPGFKHRFPAITITLAEVWQGVRGLDAADRRRTILARFAANLPQVFRLLPFDERTAEAWGEITRRGRPPLPVRDF